MAYSYFKTGSTTSYPYFKTSQTRVSNNTSTALTGTSPTPAPSPSPSGGIYKTTPSGLRAIDYQVFDQEKYDVFAKQKQLEAKRKEEETTGRITAFDKQRQKQLAREELGRRKQLIGKERVTVKQPVRLSQTRKAPVVEAYQSDVKRFGYKAQEDIQKTTVKEFEGYNKEVEKINKQLQEYKPMKTMTRYESSYFYVSPEGKRQQIDYGSAKAYETAVKQAQIDYEKSAKVTEYYLDPVKQQSVLGKPPLQKTSAYDYFKPSVVSRIEEQSKVYDKYFDIERARIGQLTSQEKTLQRQIQDIQFKQDEQKLLGVPVTQAIRESDLRKQGAIAGIGLERSFDIGRVTPEETQTKAMLQTQLFSVQQQKKILEQPRLARQQQMSLDPTQFNKQLQTDYNRFVKQMEGEYGKPISQAQAEKEFEIEMNKAYALDPQRVATSTGTSAVLGGTLGFFSGGPAAAAGGAASLGALAIVSEFVRSGTYSGLKGAEQLFGKENVEFFYPSVPSPKKFVEQAVRIQKGEEPLFSGISPIQYFGKTTTPIKDYLVEESYFEPGTKGNIADFAGLVTFFGGSEFAKKSVGQIAESTTARLYTRALGYKQISIKGVPALVKKGNRVTDVVVQQKAFPSSIHKNPLAGDISEKELRKLLNLGTGEKVRISTVMDTFPGFDPKAGDKFLATQVPGAAKKPWLTPQRSPLYGQPGKKDFELFAREFSSQLKPGQVKYGADSTIVFRQPKALGLSFYEKVSDPVALNKQLKALEKMFSTGTPATKRAVLGEAQRLYAGKAFSGKWTEPIENFMRKIVEPQASLQKQGFMLSTTQKIRGTGLFFKESLGSPYFYDTLAMPGKKTLLSLQQAQNVLGATLRKTSFTKNLERLFQQSGLGRSYKQVSLFNVEPFIPRGRPPKEQVVLPRETARYVPVRTVKGVKQYQLLEERSGQFGTGGGAIDPRFDVAYYKGSKIGMKGGRIVLDAPKVTAKKELFEELGQRALFYKRVPLTARGDPYIGKFFKKTRVGSKFIAEQQFQDFTRNVYVPKGVITTGTPTHAGEILSKKWFTATAVASSPKTDKFTKEIIRKLDVSLAKQAGKPFVTRTIQSTKDYLKQFQLPSVSRLRSPTISPKSLSNYYYGNVKYVSPTSYLAPVLGVGKYYADVKRQEYYVPKNVVRQYSLPSYKQEYFAPKKQEYIPRTGKYDYVYKPEPTPPIPRPYVGKYGEPRTTGYPSTYIMPYKIPDYKTPPYTPPPTRTPPRMPPITPTKKRKELVEQPQVNPMGTYHAFVRRNNNTKWVKVTKTPKPYNMAFNKGLMVADNTVARSVKLKRVSKTDLGMDDPFIYDQKFDRRKTGSKIPGQEVIFVEKTPHLIDTMGEKQGLKASKYLKQRSENAWGF